MKSEKYKKQYNNLMDSIVITIFLVVAIIMLVLPISLAITGNVKEGTNIKAVIIAAPAIFGTISLILLYWIIRHCYGYYVICENRIIYRNIYSKKTIMFCDIKKIEIKEGNALILGTYKTEMLCIYGEKTVIKIFINDKNKDKILKFAEILKEYI